MPVVQDIINMPHWVGIPPLRGLVEAPTFAPDGTLLTTSGYHPSTELWFHGGRAFEVAPVPERPTAGQIEAARDLLL
jgi:hypothetical protein